jgi:hypothetical protein
MCQMCKFYPSPAYTLAPTSGDPFAAISPIQPISTHCSNIIYSPLYPLPCTNSHIPFLQPLSMHIEVSKSSSCPLTTALHSVVAGIRINHSAWHWEPLGIGCAYLIIRRRKSTLQVCTVASCNGYKCFNLSSH